MPLTPERRAQIRAAVVAPFLHPLVRRGRAPLRLPRAEEPKHPEIESAIAWLTWRYAAMCPPGISKSDLCPGCGVRPRNPARTWCHSCESHYQRARLAKYRETHPPKKRGRPRKVQVLA